MQLKNRFVCFNLQIEENLNVIIIQCQWNQVLSMHKTKETILHSLSISNILIWNERSLILEKSFIDKAWIYELVIKIIISKFMNLWMILCQIFSIITCCTFSSLFHKKHGRSSCISRLCSLCSQVAHYIFI